MNSEPSYCRNEAFETASCMCLMNDLLIMQFSPHSSYRIIHLLAQWHLKYFSVGSSSGRAMLLQLSTVFWLHSTTSSPGWGINPVSKRLCGFATQSLQSNSCSRGILRTAAELKLEQELPLSPFLSVFKVGPAENHQKSLQDADRLFFITPVLFCASLLFLLYLYPTEMSVSLLRLVPAASGGHPSSTVWSSATMQTWS